MYEQALTAAMKDKPEVWQSVPEARALAAGAKLSELRDDIVALARGGDDAGDKARVSSCFE